MMAFMSKDGTFEKPLEDAGITLGPEEALAREIAKSKSLKVERLRHRDTIQKLEQKNAALSQKNRQLEEKISHLNDTGSKKSPSTQEPTPQPQNAQTQWLFILAILEALVILVLFFLLWR